MEKEHVTNENRKVSKVFPWFLCALSFIVQFIGMGFYRGFGSIYVALQNEFDENDAVLGKMLDMLLHINSYSRLFSLQFAVLSWQCQNKQLKSDFQTLTFRFWGFPLSWSVTWVTNIFMVFLLANNAWINQYLSSICISSSGNKVSPVSFQLSHLTVSWLEQSVSQKFNHIYRKEGVVCNSSWS